MNFVLKMMDFLFKMMDFVLKMMIPATSAARDCIREGVIHFY